MEQSKIDAMMEGRTLTKENIYNMYQMVRNASDTEEKKNVMKHSVFFVGQLPLRENHVVDVAKTERILNTVMPLEEIGESMQYLLDGLATQTLLIKKEDGSYEVNTKYEKTVIKARKIARAYQLEQGKAREETLPKAKKMYQMGTKYYHSGQYTEAAACFLNAVEMADHRMACYSLAMMYKEGKGVDMSLSEALYYARKAIVQGGVIAEPLEREILLAMGSAD
ncbi:MAG: SEL1-like repeat protein [Clostridiales bacterium]|nr:SEL1-like repeat protein [Clostridiales bacterium]